MIPSHLPLIPDRDVFQRFQVLASRNPLRTAEKVSRERVDLGEKRRTVLLGGCAPFTTPLEVGPTRGLSGGIQLRPYQTRCNSAARKLCSLPTPTANLNRDSAILTSTALVVTSTALVVTSTALVVMVPVEPVSSPLSSDTSPSTRRQPRCAGGRLRAHRAARRACLRAMPAQATPACAMPAKPPSSHRPNSHACHPVSATAQPACLRDALRLRDTATPRTCHPVPPCDPDSAPTVSALRSRRAARMACHLSPPTPADALSPSPPPHATQKATSQTLNYQGRRPAFATA